MSPVNHGLLQQYQLLDYDSYAVNTDLIAQVAGGVMASNFKLPGSCPCRLFHDSMHMTDEGNAAVAKFLNRTCGL